jgi:hypothetical protein
MTLNFDAIAGLLSRLLKIKKRMAVGKRRVGFAAVCAAWQCGIFSVWLQFNPKRLMSTGRRSIPNQSANAGAFASKIFQEQIGVLYEDEFLILCNPYPIFDAHFTISHTQHRPQIIDPYFESLLRLARDLKQDYTVFYNGAQCGASAPDHFHFQAAPAGKIPIEHESLKTSRREYIQEIDGVAVVLLKDLGRAAFVFEGTRLESLANVLRQQLVKMKAVLNTHEEPKVNMLCHYNAPQWRVTLFPRRQHRPAVFSKKAKTKSRLVRLRSTWAG